MGHFYENARFKGGRRAPSRRTPGPIESRSEIGSHIRPKIAICFCGGELAKAVAPLHPGRYFQ